MLEFAALSHRPAVGGEALAARVRAERIKMGLRFLHERRLALAKGLRPAAWTKGQVKLIAEAQGFEMREARRDQEVAERRKLARLLEANHRVR